MSPKTETTRKKNAGRQTKKSSTKTNWKKFWNRLLLVVLLLFAAGYGVYLLIKPSTEMLQLAYATVPLSTEHPAVFIRDELVVNTNNPGIFKPTAQDGQRVKRNDIVGVFEVVDGAQVPEKPAAGADGNVAVAGNQAPGGSRGVLVDEKVLQGEAQAIYEAMVDALRRQRFAEAQNMKRELDFKLERLKKLQEESSENAFHLKLQRTAQVGSGEAEAGTQLAINAVEEGTISLRVDGLEDTITFENRYQIDFSQLFHKEIPLVSIGDTPVAFNEPLFKIVNTERWYLACQIGLDAFDLYNREEKVDVVIGGERLEGRVQETFASGQLGILVLRMSQPIADGQALRSTKVKLVREDVKGLVIPKTALVSRGGNPGIYTTDQTDRIIFKPIRIIAEVEGDKVVVHEGQFTTVDSKGETQQVMTVHHGERILKNPTGKREGDNLAP